LKTAVKKRVLLSTWVFPPESTGSGYILYQLLRHFPQEELVAVHGIGDPGASKGRALDVVRSPVSVLGSHAWTRRIMRRLPAFFIPYIRRRIVKLARKYGVQRIYAHFPEGCFTVAAWQAAEQLGLPLTIYLDILWEESNVEGAALARAFEHKVLQRADRRFAITEFAVEHLQRKHGVKVELLPHTTDISGLPEGLRPLSGSGPPVVHFAGGVNAKMNGDAVLRLARAAAIAKTAPKLDLCAPRLPAEIRELGFGSRYVDQASLAEAQARSTVLFLPLAFEGPQPLMIRHNFPTKAMDYLRSGRPILVHAPADSYLTWLAKKEGFALVVDRPDVEELAVAIDRLVGDRRLQEDFVAKALKFVRTRDSRPWADVLWKALCSGK
jgi:glycosyltransferase involved in cell wall biosynthesis